MRPPRGTGYRLATPLPPEPSRLDVLAGVYDARRAAGRRHAFDSRLETSCCASIAYLWRLGRYGQAWARQGTGTYATTLLQLTIGLAPIMGWTEIPAADDLAGREAFLRRHRASVQRWLDWLAQTGLVAHEPETLQNGQWHRTRITLLPFPAREAAVLEAIVDRERGWQRRERRRQGRGRRRNLSAILRRSRLSRAQRRQRGIANRRRRQAYQQAQRVAEHALLDTHLSYLRPPIEPWTTSQGSSDLRSSENPSDRGMTRELIRREPAPTSRETHNNSSQEKRGIQPSLSPTLIGLQALMGRRYQGPDLNTGDGRRSHTYHEVLQGRDQLSDSEIERRLLAQQRRREQLIRWNQDETPELWWLAELFVSSTYSPEIAALPLGFRLAFLSPVRDASTLAGAARAYRRAAISASLPAGFPPHPIAGFAHWLLHYGRSGSFDHPRRCRQSPARRPAKDSRAPHRDSLSAPGFSRPTVKNLRRA